MDNKQRKIRVKTFTFSLPTPYGTLPTLSMEVPDLPMGLSDVVPLLQELCNKCVEIACAHGEPEEKVRCSRGCGSCCRQVVPIALPEALYLQTFLDGLPPERREHYRTSLNTVAAASRENGILQALQQASSDQDALAAAEAYFNQGYDCPFLEDGACAIHPVRPFACREFNAITPPELCENPFRNSVRKVTVVPKMTSVAARFAAKVTGEPPVLIPLVALCDAVENSSEAGKKYPGIHLFEELFDSFT